MNHIQTDFDAPYSIISLLHHTENSELLHRQHKLDDLCLIQHIVEFSIDALKTFLAGHLNHFDAQVGENLCQIRAYKTMMIAKKWLVSTEKREEFATRITLLDEYIKRVDQDIAYFKKIINYTGHSKSLDDVEDINFFLLRQNLFLLLDEDTIYLIMCFFLRRFRVCVEHIPVAININNIQAYFHISKYKVKKLVRKYQAFVCKMGNEFILQIAKDFPSTLGYNDILPYVSRHAENGRQVLPCLLVTEIILSHCLMNTFPIILVVRRKNIFDEIKDIVYFTFVAHASNIFSLESIESFFGHHQYAMIIWGETVYKKDNDENASQFVKKITKHDLMTLLLANMASHPQYTGKSLVNFRDDPYQDVNLNEMTHQMTNFDELLRQLRAFAIEQGCAQENKTLLFLKHMYAGHLTYEIMNIKSQRKDIPVFNAHYLLSSVDV